MVIISTRAVEVSSQAVSPESGPAASCAQAGETRPSPTASTPRMSGIFLFMIWNSWFGRSQGLRAGFPGADARDVIERQNENLPVADGPGPGGGLDGFGHRPDGGVIHGHGDLHLGQEVHFVFRHTIDSGMPLLSAIAPDFRHGQAFDAGFRPPEIG